MPGAGREIKMRHLICASAALAFVVAPAGAEHRYDRKLEQAAMRIVAENIGDIRGGFSYGQKLRFVMAQDALPQGIEPSQKPDMSVTPSIIAPAGSPKS
jgi:hypothetical protein